MEDGLHGRHEIHLFLVAVLSFPRRKQNRASKTLSVLSLKKNKILSCHFFENVLII